MAERYLVEPEFGDKYLITRVQAETRLVDLREQETEVTGDLVRGFEYWAPWPSYAGLVRVAPFDPGAPGNDSGASGAY